MSDKSNWLGGILGKRSAKPLATSAKHCPQGHPMSIDWGDRCPYCEAAKSAAERTRVSSLSNAGKAPPPSTQKGRAGPTLIYGAQARAGEAAEAEDASSASRNSTGTGGRRSTRVFGDATSGAAAPPVTSSAAAGSTRRRTHVIDVEDVEAERERLHAGGGRALTGIVFTFSWTKLGQLFEVRDGRNYAGSGTVGPDERPLDIQLSNDEKMSGAHFLILCQGEKYRIRDCDSTNGTYVNGEQIDALGIELEDGAVILAGTTMFGFQMVRPPSVAARHASPMEPDPEVEDLPPPPPPRYDPGRSI